MAWSAMSSEDAMAMMRRLYVAIGINSRAYPNRRYFERTEDWEQAISDHERDMAKMHAKKDAYAEYIKAARIREDNERMTAKVRELLGE